MHRTAEANHARTHHGQRARKLIEAQQVVAREHMLSVARRERILHRRRPDGDDDGPGRDLVTAAIGNLLETNTVRVDERSARGENVDVVPHQLMAGHVDFVADDMIDAKQQVAHRDVLLDRVRRAVDPALTISGESKRGLA
jgi:hypothetical protein